MRKPLSALDKAKSPLSESEKQDWLAPLDVMNDLMGLSKQVTFRSSYDTIISVWNDLNVDPTIWDEVTNQKGIPIDHHWNKISIKAEEINYKRAI